MSEAISNLKKRYGEDILFALDGKALPGIEAISTGSLALDMAIGIGGIPRGRITEIYGPDASGKTTLCYHILAEAQRNDNWGAFIDVEHVLDPAYAQTIGVNFDRLHICQPDYGEQALEVAEALVRSGEVVVVIIDSVAALVPKAELEGDMGSAHIGLQARLMSQALRKLAGSIRRSNTAVVFTNQLRMKIGVMFGNPETTTGGMALRFYASVRIDLRAGSAKEAAEIGASKIKASIRKNKVAPPYKVAEFYIIHGKGIDKLEDLIDVAVDKQVLERRGPYYAYNGQTLGQGKQATKEALNENSELFITIRGQVLNAIRNDF